MYQSFVYIEARILLPPVPSVFITDGKISVDREVLRRVFTLTNALGCIIMPSSEIEHLTGNLPQPEKDFKFTGYSIKAAEGGTMDIMFHRRPKTIHIEELRIEEDAGRLTHANGKPHIDFSHAGCPSIRIKTAPSFELGEEVQLFLDELRRLTQYLHISNEISGDCIIRCNAFVAISRYPELPDYYVKLRNLNSSNFARKAVNSELTRQENMLLCGERAGSESRIWNEHKECTEFYQPRNSIIQRFEHLSPAQYINLEQLSNETAPEENVELPETRRLRFRSQYGVSKLRADFLCDYKDRADFFEAAVALGADPLNAAHWMSSELARLLNKTGIPISKSKIKPEHFAFIIKKLDSGDIHSSAAKTLIRASFETGSSPDRLMKSLNISELAGEKELLPYIRKAIRENPALCKRLQSGEMPPLEFLTGLVMKETHGKAVPQIVKSLIKRELDISIIYMLTTGGAISAIRHTDGSISSGDSTILRSIISEISPDAPVQIISAGQFLSEEIEPSDWAALIAETAARINAGIANGIVVTHGTYTLSYTAALLFWLFSDAGVPIVITASSSLPSESSEAKENLELAIKTAEQKKNGVYVAYGGKILSPLNLHLDRPGIFRNWNLRKLSFTESGPIAAQFAGTGDLDKDVITQLLVEAAGRMFLCRLYPGFRSDLYKKILKDSKVHSVFLEMYGIGCGNMRDSDFSLNPLLLDGNRRGIRFYCTSQQEINIDFSQYTTARNVWREGAVPMGYLTTESATALYFACAIAADSDTEFDELMETYANLYSD